MSEPCLLIESKKLIVLSLTFICLLSGCSTTKYVSKQHPNGNIVLSEMAYKKCVNKVPEDVREDAKSTRIKNVVYVPPTPGYGGLLMDLSENVCKGRCAEARREKDWIIKRCMADKGWRLK